MGEESIGRQPLKHSSHESEERLRLALEAGRMGTWEWNLETNQVTWSQGLEAIHGLAPGTFAGTFEAFQSDIHPEDRGSVLRSISETVELGKQHRIEYRLLWPDGAIHWVEGRGKLFHDGSGKPIRMAGICIDVDERKRLEQELRERVHELAEAEARIRSVVDNVIDGIITIDESGRVASFNPAAETIFGYSSSDVIGRSIELLMAEPYPSEPGEHGKNYLRTRDAAAIGVGREVTGRRKDGSTFPMDLAVSEVRWSQGRFFTGVVRDLTERRHVEQSLRFLADASEVLSTLVDYESTLRRVADASISFFADWCTIDILEPDGLLRRLAVSHIDPEKVKLAYELAQQFRPLPGFPHGAHRVLQTGRAEIAAEVSDSMLVDFARDERHLHILRELGVRSYMCVPLKVRGKVLAVVSFVTAQRRRRYSKDDLVFAEELARRAGISLENAQLYEELKDADRRKDEFLATLAHELRNPLAPIRSAVELIRLASGNEETLERAATVMERQVQQMVRLIDDLMDVSRITRNKLDLRTERLKLSDVVESAVETSRALIEASRHVLDVKLPDEEIYLDADLTRLAQVFANLINNACKYTESGGRISLSAQSRGDLAVVTVEDNGIGIPAESLPHIFELFSQVDLSLERAQGGLGIGLTLVKRLVEMHGGSVEARSQGPGQGSQFAVRLPLARTVQAAHASVAGGDSSEAHRQPNKYRVLVVDDNADLAESLGILLHVKGNDVRTACNGLEAVELAASFQPHLVLLDIGMPKLNGYDAARRIRAQQQGRKVILVAMTGWGQEQDVARSKEAGFDHHMVKPVDPSALDRLLAEL